jgi:hypothetical protein
MTSNIQVTVKRSFSYFSPHSLLLFKKNAGFYVFSRDVLDIIAQEKILKKLILFTTF